MIIYDALTGLIITTTEVTADGSFRIDNFPVNGFPIENWATGYLFELNASNEFGARQASILLKGVPQIPPPSPYNVTGVLMLNPAPSPFTYTATINWEYNRPELISGFNIHKSVNGGDFVKINENIVDIASPWQWIDLDAQMCAVYYITAVYYDWLAKSLVETGPSTNFWYTDCP